MIALVGDTHLPRGSRALPPSCVRVLEAADVVVHTGDFTSLGALAEMEAYGPLVAVHGNMDEWEVRTRLPERAVADVEGLRLGLVHDAGPRRGRHERLRGWFPDCSLLVYGHSHEPEVSRSGEAWVLNPGSPTERRRAGRHTMIVLRDGRPELVDLDA